MVALIPVIPPTPVESLAVPLNIKMLLLSHWLGSFGYGLVALVYMDFLFIIHSDVAAIAWCLTYKIKRYLFRSHPLHRHLVLLKNPCKQPGQELFEPHSGDGPTHSCLL